MSHLGVFKNRVMRKIVGCKTEEVIGDWRNLYNEELCDFYSSQNIILAIKLRQMRWVGIWHVSALLTWFRFVF
jgi:hypothetical protein